MKITMNFRSMVLALAATCSTGVSMNTVAPFVAVAVIATFTPLPARADNPPACATTTQGCPGSTGVDPYPAPDYILMGWTWWANWMGTLLYPCSVDFMYIFDAMIGGN